jgi:hypothetical protein
LSCIIKTIVSKNNRGERMHPCRMPVSMSKNSVSPVSDLMQHRYKFLNNFMNLFGIP